MEAHLLPIQPVHGFRARQRHKHQYRAHALGKDGGQSRAQHAHAQHRDQHNVQSDVHQARDDEEVQRAAGVAHGPQDAGTHVIQKGRDGAQHVNAQIGEGKVHDVGRGAHGAQRPGRGRHADCCKTKPRGQSQRHRGMHRTADALCVVRTVRLRDDHCRAGGKPHEQVDEEVDERARSAAHGGQRLRANELPHDDGVRRVVKLLKKRTEQNREKEIQQLLPDHALGDLVHGHPSADPFDAHAEIHSFFSKQADYSTTARGSR